jgi:hypothetical protein
MSRILVITALLAAMAAPAWADYDAAGEAREAAARKAEQQEQARRKAEINRQRAEAEQKMMRGSLGAEAQGKSDAEVKRIYDARMKGYLDQAKKAESAGATSGSDMDRANAQMKAVTGKSMQDVAKMSPAEQEAFAKQMEKQHGGTK